MVVVQPHPVRYALNWKPTLTEFRTEPRPSTGHHGQALSAGWRLYRIGNVTHMANANTLSRSMLKKSIEQPATKGHRVEIRAARLV
jgi:hypothetical protein